MGANQRKLRPLSSEPAQSKKAAPSQAILPMTLGGELIFEDINFVN